MSTTTESLAPSGAGERPARARPAALFVDRQSSLLREICSQASPDPGPVVAPMRRLLDGLRAFGTAVVVASHNRASTWDPEDTVEIAAMNRRIEQALGPVDLWSVCLVDPDGSCDCARPGGGLVRSGAEALGLDVHGCAVVTDDRRLVAGARSVGVANLLEPVLGGHLPHERWLALATEHLLAEGRAMGVLVEGGPARPPACGDR